MKLIIDIPKEDYNFVKKQVADGITNPLKMRIANGIPLDGVLQEIWDEIGDLYIEPTKDEAQEYSNQTVAMALARIDKHIGT